VARFILLTILLILIARAFWRVVDGVIEAAGGRPSRSTPPTAVKLVRDPVCGTYVAPSTALSLTARGRTQYFCSEKCRDEFGKK
jgi:uncharacterized protein